MCNHRLGGGSLVLRFRRFVGDRLRVNIECYVRTSVRHEECFADDIVKKGISKKCFRFARHKPTRFSKEIQTRLSRRN